MSQRREAVVVYAAGVAQGVVLVTLPAASTIFTNSAYYGLSPGGYGALFVPQVTMAVLTSLLGAELVRRSGSRAVYLAGLVANLTGMGLLLASATVADQRAIAYPLLLLAAAGVGTGFGLTVPVLNALTAALHPRRVDSSVLVLNALLGLGTVLAPLFVAVFTGLGFWWGLPATAAALLVALLLVSLPLPMRAGPTIGPPAGPTIGPYAGSAPASGTGSTPAAGPGPRPSAHLPARFWLYAGFILVYGVCETVNGNWSALTMTTELGATTATAALALTAFWAMVTLGRIGFALVQRWFPTRWTFHTLPFVLAGAFLLISALGPDRGGPALGVASFGLAGLGCSALLPLTISFAQEQFPAAATTAAGTVIAFYQLGYGIAAFGVGPLHAAGVPLSDVFQMAALVALGLGALSFAVAHPPTARLGWVGRDFAR